MQQKFIYVTKIQQQSSFNMQRESAWMYCSRKYVQVALQGFTETWLTNQDEFHKVKQDMLAVISMQ